VKLAALCLLALGLAVATAISCSIKPRSSDFACTAKADCARDRECIDGFCVLPQLDGGIIDTLPPGIDASLCPPQCTSCNLAQHSCTIDCAANPTACSRHIACPLGWGCNVDCSSANSCRSGVDCAGSTSCNVTCSGDRSCRDITCSIGTCGITCSGPDSCDGVKCGTDTCKVDCTGPGSCPAIGCSLGDCTIDCTNDDSCANVTCGVGACNVGCTGRDSCGEVDCGLSCACEVDCQFGSCANVTCKQGCVESNPFDGCTSQRDGCNMCL
jgi:hypothetical protein